MDFSSHLRRVNRLLSKDDRIDIDHINLYNSLFVWWHYHRDGDKVAICHKRMMRYSGIRSKNIYDVKLIALDHYGYIMLLPPAEKGEACMVRMIILQPEQPATNPSPKKEEKFFIKKQKPVNEEENLKETMLKLVREIIDRVLLLKIHLEKEV